MKYFCEFCNKECKNKNSYAQHKIRCKDNPDKIEIKNNFICYNEKVKSGEVIKKHTNQYTKAIELNLPKPEITNETRRKISNALKNREWTDEQRLKQSNVMKNAVKAHPDSYSASNVSGRVKTIHYKDTKVKGQWELLVAEQLDIENINWTNIIEPLEYEWNGKTHLYFPDFYLVDYNLYIEVKGYETNRDIAKWRAVQNLVVLKSAEIKRIRKGELIFNMLP